MLLHNTPRYLLVGKN